MSDPAGRDQLDAPKHPEAWLCRHVAERGGLTARHCITARHCVSTFGSRWGVGPGTPIATNSSSPCIRVQVSLASAEQLGAFSPATSNALACATRSPPPSCATSSVRLWRCAWGCALWRSNFGPPASPIEEACRHPPLQDWLRRRLPHMGQGPAALAPRGPPLAPPWHRGCSPPGPGPQAVLVATVAPRRPNWPDGSIESASTTMSDDRGRCSAPQAA